MIHIRERTALGIISFYHRFRVLMRPCLKFILSVFNQPFGEFLAIDFYLVLVFVIFKYLCSSEQSFQPQKWYGVVELVR